MPVMPPSHIMLPSYQLPQEQGSDPRFSFREPFSVFQSAEGDCLFFKKGKKDKETDASWKSYHKYLFSEPKFGAMDKEWEAIAFPKSTEATQNISLLAIRLQYTAQ